MSKIAKLIAAVAVAVAALLAEQFASNGIQLGEDWPQLVASVLTPFVVWRWPNKPPVPRA